MSLSCTVTLKEEKEVLSVPIESIYQNSEGKNYVVKVNEDGTTTDTIVELGIANDNYVQVKSGLNLNEKVQIWTEVTERTKSSGKTEQNIITTNKLTNTHNTNTAENNITNNTNSNNTINDINIENTVVSNTDKNNNTLNDTNIENTVVSNTDKSNNTLNDTNVENTVVSNTDKSNNILNDTNVENRVVSNNNENSNITKETEYKVVENKKIDVKIVENKQTDNHEKPKEQINKDKINLTNEQENANSFEKKDNPNNTNVTNNNEINKMSENLEVNLSASTNKSMQSTKVQSISYSTNTMNISSMPSQTDTAVYNGSSNNYLSNLEIEGENFNTTFNKENTTYFVQTNGKTELNVKVTSEDDESKIYVTGNDNLKTGDNKILISVTAENGDARYYRVFVTNN